MLHELNSIYFYNMYWYRTKFNTDQPVENKIWVFKAGDSHMSYKCCLFTFIVVRCQSCVNIWTFSDSSLNLLLTVLCPKILLIINMLVRIQIFVVFISLLLKMQTHSFKQLEFLIHGWTHMLITKQFIEKFKELLKTHLETATHHIWLFFSYQIYTFKPNKS